MTREEFKDRRWAITSLGRISIIGFVTCAIFISNSSLALAQSNLRKGSFGLKGGVPAGTLQRNRIDQYNRQRGASGTDGLNSGQYDTKNLPSLRPGPRVGPKITGPQGAPNFSTKPNRQILNQPNFQYNQNPVNPGPDHSPHDISRENIPAAIKEQLSPLMEGLSGPNFKKSYEDYEKLRSGIPSAAERRSLDAQWAEGVQNSVRFGHADRQSLQQAASYYKSRLGDLKGRELFIFKNKYASVLMDLDQRKEAAEQLALILKNISTLSGRDQSRVLYNFGRAIESENPILAASKYKQAALADPTYWPAAKAVLRVLFNVPPKRSQITQAAEWLSTLVQRNDLDIAKFGIQQFLRNNKWYLAAGFEEILRSSIDFMISARISSADFDNMFKVELETIAKYGKSSAKFLAADLAAVWENKLPAAFGEKQRNFVYKEFPHLSKQASGSKVSRYFKIVGDAKSNNSKTSREAISRYATAWSLDTTNIDAAIGAVATLLDYGEDLDPNQVLIGQLVSFLTAKNEKTNFGTDWHALLRFHTLLGQLFANQKKWGPRGNPRSASFHWNEALIFAEIIKTKKEAYRVPVLRASYVAALAEIADMDKAILSPRVAAAQRPVQVGTVTMEGLQVGFTIRSTSFGDGELRFKGKTYPFKVKGLGVGGIGISNIYARGEVYDMETIADFPGLYGQARAGIVVGNVGKGSLWLENNKGVYLRITAKREGLALSVGADGIVIQMDK